MLRPEPQIDTDSAVAAGWGWHRRIEVLVLTDTGLEHFRRRTDRPDRPWQVVATVSEKAIGPGALAGGSGLRARVVEADGVCIYRYDGQQWLPDPDQRWDPPARAEPPSPADLGLSAEQVRAVAACEAGWPQAVVDLDGSLYGYHRRPDGRWQRASCLRVAAAPWSPAANSSTKVAQVTGELDATPTPWGERAPTLSRSHSTAGIRGTDLGVSVTYQGRRFLLLGDTHWTRPWLALRDAIAEVTDDGDRPSVRFHGSPLKLRGLGTTTGEYDVPLDAFEQAGALYAVFSSNHGRSRQVMGRSVLSRMSGSTLLVDPKRRHHRIRFDALATLSDQHFINVSVQRRPAAQVPGCGTSGDVVLLWGTGAYRASEVRLAVLDAVALDRLADLDPPVATPDLGLRYWDGAGWSTQETAAAPLFTPGAYGELSVRWVPAVRRFAMLTATGPGDAAGNAITLRWADHPAGPWTPPLRLLDWVATGMTPDPFTRFIKAAPDDEVGESLFAAQARGNGAAYAPYFFSADLDATQLVLRYTLSTWNPYQVVLMEHRLEPGEY